MSRKTPRSAKPSIPPLPPEYSKRVGFVVAAGVAVVFVLTLYLASGGDLWFDELWSLSAAVGVQNIWDIFGLHHDNNHHMNTIWLYLCGDQTNFRVYRLLSIFCGLAFFVTMGFIAYRKWGTRSALISLFFVTFSYPLILYFTEARGYAGAVVCALVAFWIFRSLRENFTFIRICSFAIVSTLGLGFHSTFLVVLISLGLANLLSLCKAGSFGPKTLNGAISAFIFPAAVCFIWFWFYWRHVEIGGGPESTLIGVVGDFASYTLGIPNAWPLFAVAALAILTLVGTEYARRKNEGDFLFFPIIVLIIPALVLLISKPEYLHFRYFLVTMPFFYLCMARLLDLAMRTKLGIFFSLLLILPLLGLQAARIGRLVVQHRGSYHEAMALLWNESAAESISVSSDHDTRNSLLVAFYSPPSSGSKSLTYIPNNQDMKKPTDWYILHTQNPSEPAEKIITDPSGARYLMRGDFPFEGVSGWRWAIYKREK